MDQSLQKRVVPKGGSLLTITGQCVAQSFLEGAKPLSGTYSNLVRFHGWYDLIVTVAEDSAFHYRLAGHVETGKDSFTDPALGGLVTLKG